MTGLLWKIPLKRAFRTSHFAYGVQLWVNSLIPLTGKQYKLNERKEKSPIPFFLQTSLSLSYLLCNLDVKRNIRKDRKVQKQDKQEKKKKIKDKKIRRGVLSFTLSFLFTNSVWTEIGWETSHSPLQKIFLKLNDLKKGVKRTLANIMQAINTELTLKKLQIAWSAFQEKKTRQLTQNECRVQKKQDLFKNSSHLKVANLQVHPFTFLFFKIN